MRPALREPSIGANQFRHTHVSIDMVLGILEKRVAYSTYITTIHEFGSFLHLQNAYH